MFVLAAVLGVLALALVPAHATDAPRLETQTV
jgi:hypothetical protein